MKRKIFILILFLIGIAHLCFADVKEFTRATMSMNTLINIKVFAQDNKPITEAFKLLDILDKELSMYNSSSTISRINSNAGHEKISVPDEVLEVIKDCLRIYEMSDGVFNPLIGSVTNLWKINQADNTIPSPESLDEAVKLSDISNLEIENNSIYLKHEGCILDLGGIAKGYASKKISDILKANGVNSAIIDLGGNVQVLGKKIDGSNWNIGVRDPSNARGKPALVLSLNDTAVITSGGYERFKIVNGKKYSHFFDVKTGQSITNDLLSATVVTPDGSLADGLATAFMAAGFDRSLEIMKNIPSSTGVILIRLVDGEIKIYATENLSQSISRALYSVSVM